MNSSQEQNLSEKRAPAQAAEDISRRLINTLKDGGLKVTIDRIDQPAYMVNYNLEITWYNEAARAWLGDFDHLPEESKARHVLQHLSRGIYGQRADNQSVFNKLHWEAGRARLTGTAMAGTEGVDRIDASRGPIMEFPVHLRRQNDTEERYSTYVSYFREGMLFVYTPELQENDGLLGILARRDEVIRDLLKSHLPVLTDVAVLVADLQDSTLICLELPPEEYFELINHMWAAMEPIFRRYYGTHGKHVGDGMVYYFFPQPDCSYLLNAIRCASELRAEIRKISQSWQLRKNWGHTLKLKIGLHEGSEWLGTFHIDSKVEFTVLGDTINHASRLSDFARGGTIWASKSMMSKLVPEDRRKLRYGIRRRDAEGVETLVEATFSPVSALIDPDRHGKKLKDIGGLPVTEIVEVIG
ncbi:MAG: hypothetical protein A3J49_02470 [Gallionellales bacterium RIFCSPHIGHO2_02_FULL_57_16]|nr:MAG: hypothetical protein A3J49_02470 [Gallionellales bacterium RIFCSPHIGHO2_02_FULL_57_16]